jgi:hypothetical protein
VVTDNVEKMRNLMETLSHLDEVPDMPFIKPTGRPATGAPVKIDPKKMRSRVMPNSIDGQRGLAMEQHLSDAIEELQQIEDISRVLPEHRDAIVGMAEVILQSFNRQ